MRTVGCLAVACALMSACTSAPAPQSPTRASPAPTVGRASPLAPASNEPAPTAPATAAASETALADLVDGPAMLTHLEELQQIADEHGGHRATASAGFDASVLYVERHLRSADYAVDRQAFAVGSVTSSNLIVELAGAGDDVVMLGAHLDSVAAGPGINDNGSGVAALLVIAEQLRQLPKPARTVRFAFWGAEEGGPFGSRAYVNGLEPDERERITAYLNFDMIGSSNAIRFVYDEPGAAPGSEALAGLFATAFDDSGLAWEPIDLQGDSDHGPFIEAGIPTGGLFSGGIEPVTDAQAATSGAVAGEPADPCSHRACDTLDNVDLATLEEMAQAIVHVLAALAVE